MLEPSTPRALPLPPPPAPEPAYPALRAVLRAARQRARTLHLRAVLYATLGALLLLWPLPLAFADHVAVARIAALLLPALALIGFALGGPLYIWRRSRDDEGAATLLADHAPELRSALLTAVQLQRVLDQAPSRFSRELALAHIAQTADRAHQLDLARLLPRRNVRLGAGLLGLGLLCAALCVGLAPRLFLTNLAGLWSGHETASKLAERLVEPITYDIELTYVYPAYTGLASKTVQGSGGEIAAPAGTEVKLRTRADRDVAQAFLVVGQQAMALHVEGARALSGTLLVREPGSYHFRFADARGRTVAEGPPIPIAVEADQPPHVSLSSPPATVEVDPRGEVKVRYEADDDFGLSQVDLVYRMGNSKTEQRISLSKDPAAPRRVSGDYAWSMPTLSLAAGDRVTYRIEAHDNDAVAGPQLGKSKEQVLKVYSEAEHHRLALAKVEKLWEQMIGQLAETLELPDRAAEKDVAAIAAGGAADQHAFDLVTELVDTAVELRKDKAVPKEIPRALSNIADSLRGTTSALSLNRTQFNRWSRAGAPEPTAARRLQLAAEAQITELEKDTIYLEKLLDHRRIEDLLALSRGLSAKRRDLASLLEKYQKAPDEQTKQAIQADIARLKERIGELMQRMAELQRAIHDEHLNSDALRNLAANNSMLGRLDKIQDLLNQGKTDEAMKELQRLGDQMDQLQNGLDQSQSSFEGRQDPELSQKFRDFSEQLASVSREQRALEKEAKALKQAGQAELEKKLAEKGPEFAQALRQKVAQSKKALQDASNQADAQRYDEDAQRANEALDELDRALAAKNYDAAADEAAQAQQLEQELAGDLRSEALRAQRYPAFSQSDPARLAQASEQANGALVPLQEVKKQLDQLFPRGSQPMSSEDRQKMRALEKRQEGLRQQESALQKQMEEINKKAPVFSPKMKSGMQQAGQQMTQAEGAMSERDPSASANHAGEAASRLEQVQQGLKEARQGGGGGGGLLLPGPEGGEESGEEAGDGQESEQEKVDIPNADQPGGDAYRKDIMDAMKQSAPNRYKDQVKKYYEEIVK